QPSVSLEPSTPPTPVTVTPTLSSRAYTPPPPTPKHKSEPEPDKSRKRQPKAPATPTPAATPEPTPTPTADPTPPTAALAVSKLAAREPGRHICYRAFVEGTGWQRPVCDGATAGVVKGEKKIRSLNFAVSGTKGTSANAYRHEKGWWQTPWPGVVDGVDLYVHTTKKDAPYLLGFAVNVGEGVVCANANVQTQGWHGLKCDEPGGYVFGGTLDEDLWLRAVRFTV
ncbi:hydrolase, partial [Streptomyces sp. NPDC006997]